MTKTEYMRKWRAEHPEYRDYMKRWCEEHREHTNAYQRRRYHEHREEAIARVRAWAGENPLTVALIKKAQSANRRYPGRITADDIRALVDRQGWVCYWCKKQITERRDLTLEHLRPVNDPAHLTIACLKCNSSKLPTTGRTHRRTPEERQARAGLDQAKKRVRDKQWKQANAERGNEQQRARYYANIEAKRAYFREWQRKKRERERSASAGDVPSVKPQS